MKYFRDDILMDVSITVHLGKKKSKVIFMLDSTFDDAVDDDCEDIEMLEIENYFNHKKVQLLFDANLVNKLPSASFEFAMSVLRSDYNIPWDVKYFQ